jgi:hypothetical protein
MIYTQVEDRIFTMSDRRFRRESDEARELLSRKSERKDRIIIIKGMKAMDFERFVQAVHTEFVFLLPDSVGR